MQILANNGVTEAAKPISNQMMGMRFPASVHGKRRTSRSPVRIGLALGGSFARGNRPCRGTRGVRTTPCSNNTIRSIALPAAVPGL